MSKPTFKFGPLQLQWLASLENHPNMKMKNSLGKLIFNGDGYKACCLGEAGLIAGVCEFDAKGILRTRNYEKGVLAGESYKAMGFYGPRGERRDLDNDKRLERLNDYGKTWPEIAAIVRAEPEQYFTGPK